MNQSPLLIKPTVQSAEYLRITPKSANWEHLSFATRHMAQGDTWMHDTGDNELALVVLGGVGTVSSNRGSWERIGRRPDVFSGMPYTLYLPRGTEFEVTAVSPHLDIAYGWVATDQDFPPQLISPEQVTVEIRGGENATRQINGILPPGFSCHHLVVVEVYTPSGNWSSYPPHKHDVHREDENGNLLEADLEEVYFYKIDKPEGYAYQRVYTDDLTLDELVLARDSHAVLVPEGYHPVVSAHGYNTYYLNFLAGSAQSLANSDDPQYSWVKKTWTTQDPRLPLVNMDMER